MAKKVERLLMAILLSLTIFSSLYFFFPVKAYAKMACGEAHPKDPAYCKFEEERNCCIVIK